MRRWEGKSCGVRFCDVTCSNCSVVQLSVMMNYLGLDSYLCEPQQEVTLQCRNEQLMKGVENCFKCGMFTFTSHVIFVFAIFSIIQYLVLCTTGKLTHFFSYLSLLSVIFFCQAVGTKGTSNQTCIRSKSSFKELV